MGLELFTTHSDDEIRAALTAQAKRKTRDITADLDLAIDYLENRQMADVRAEIEERYERMQDGEVGERIKAFFLPITERFISEAATTYNKPVMRELLKEDGNIDEDATKILQDVLEDIGYNEILHRGDQLTNLGGTSMVWFQVRNGDIQPRVITRQRIKAVLPVNTRHTDKGDPDDYFGFVVKLDDNPDGDSDTECEFVLLTPSEHIYYQAKEWDKPVGNFEKFPNEAFVWPQKIAEESGDVAAEVEEKELPLQMLTFWHKKLPLDDVILDVDPDLMYFNREMNVQWSVLMDTFRRQAAGQLILNLENADSPPTQVNYGTAFALPLTVGESASYVGAAISFADLTSALDRLLQTEALMKRQSPNDFSFDGTTPASGFAKKVDSIPKTEAREDRQTRLKKTEEQDAWPRLGAILAWNKKIPNAKDLKLRVTFSEAEFPASVDEVIKKDNHEFQHGISSPVAKLMKERGISKDEAEKVIEENTGSEEEQPPAAPPVATPRGAFANLVAQRA